MITFARKLKRAAERFERSIFILYLARHDPRVSLLAKVCIVLVVGYALSPIDLIPDFIPVLGYLDDILLLPVGIYICLSLIPKEVLEDLRKRVALLSELERSIITGIVIVGIWLAVVLTIGVYLIGYSGA